MSILATDIHGCVSSFLAPFIIHVYPTNSVLSTNSDQSEFHIYPNPTTNSVQIKMPWENCTIKILNMTGQIIYKEENIKTLNNKIDFSAFTKGVYFIQIESENDNIVKKLIIE